MATNTEPLYYPEELPGMDSIGRSDRQETTGGSVHHTAGTAPTTDDFEAEKDHLLRIHQYHVSKDFGGLGYHALVFPVSGRWWLPSHNLNTQRAGVAWLNHTLVHVCIAGDFTSIPPSTAALQGCRAAIQYIEGIYGKLPWRGHRIWAKPSDPTACPGDTYLQWIDLATEDIMPTEDFEALERRVLAIEQAFTHVELKLSDLVESFLDQQRGTSDFMVHLRDAVTRFQEGKYREVDE